MADASESTRARNRQGTDKLRDGKKGGYMGGLNGHETYKS